jgi:ABC-type transport system substrate-binding protein
MSRAPTWQAWNPTARRFSLHPGANIHDGSPFCTDDDAVVSIALALGPTPQRTFEYEGVTDRNERRWVKLR